MAGQPARGYSWPPFQPGHTLSLRHGAYSERTIGPLADELAGWVVGEYPDLASPRYRFALSAWAKAEARVALLELFLDARGVVQTEGDERGEPRERLLRELRAESRRAAEERRNLGLDPASHVRLEKERAEAVKGAVDLTELQRRGAEALRSRGPVRELGGDVRDGGEAS